MFPRLAEHYRSLTQDLVLSLQALASGLQSHGISASCYVCGDLQENQGASFVAEIGEQHLIRFLVSDCGISWVESRNGHELVKLDGAEASRLNRSQNCCSNRRECRRTNRPCLDRDAEDAPAGLASASCPDRALRPPAGASSWP